MRYEYLYFGLAQSLVDFQSNLLEYIDVNVGFNHLGSVVNVTSINRNGGKPTVMGILLTQTEYDTLMARSKQKLKAGVIDKIHVIENSTDLELLIKDHFGIGDEVFGVKDSGSEANEISVSEVDEVSDSEPLESENGVSETVEEPVVEEPAVIEPVLPEKYTLNTIVLNLKAEIERLNEEIYEINSKSEQGVDDSVSEAYESKLTELNERVSSLTSKVHQLEKENKELSLLNENNKTTLNELVEENRKQQERYHSLEYNYREVRSNSKQEIIFEGSVPRNVRVLGVSSDIYLPQVYEYLVTTATKNSVILDLSQVSVMDIIVKLKKPVRPTKWLIDGKNIRTMFADFEANDFFPVNDGVSIMSAPTYVYGADWVYKVDWTKAMADLESIDRPVLLFLGNVHNHGVSSLINKLNVGVSILTLKGDLLASRNSKLVKKFIDKAKVVEYEIKRGENN